MDTVALVVFGGSTIIALLNNCTPLPAVRLAHTPFGMETDYLDRDSLDTRHGTGSLCRALRTAAGQAEKGSAGVRRNDARLEIAVLATETT
jgi:hypothetical protein